MKISVKTSVLKAMMDKVARGADEQGMEQISLCVSIEAANGDLILKTTNRTHLLTVCEKNVFSEVDTVFSATVPNQLFWKLISKMTTPTVELSLTEKQLDVKGNGDYSIPLSLDTDGTVSKIRDIPFEDEGAVKFELAAAKMQDILVYNAASLVRTASVASSIVGYFVDKEGFVTYDTTACINKMQLPEVVSLMPAKLIELCSVFDGDKITFAVKPEIIKVTCKNDSLVYKLPDSEAAANYPADKLREMVKTTFESSCKINRADIVAALDRLSLFVKIGPMQIVARLRLMFDGNKLTLFDPYGKNTETIKLSEIQNPCVFTEDIDLFILKSLISCHSNEFLNISYGNETGIMILDKDIIQLIPYLEPDTNLSEPVEDVAAFATIANNDEDDVVDNGLTGIAVTTEE